MNNMEQSLQYKYVLTCEELADLCGTTENEIKEHFNQSEILSIRGGKTIIPPIVVKNFLKKNGFDYSCHVLAIINMRGGIGKTTTSINTATRAKQYGFKTCIIDIDHRDLQLWPLTRLPKQMILFFTTSGRNLTKWSWVQ